VPSFTKSKGKTSPPKKGSIFGVLKLKTRKNGEVVRKNGGWWRLGTFIALGLTEAATY
jgi:hypothetical protein